MLTVQRRMRMNRTLKPLTPLEQDILAESFKDIQPMLNKIVLNHHTIFGGNLDDLFSEAQEIFILAHMRHDETKSALTTWVYFIVSQGLINYEIKKSRKMKGCKNVSLETIKTTNPNKDSVNCNLEEKKKRKDLEILLSEVGEDCKNIIYLIIFPPKDFEEESLKQKRPKQWKNFIREYLHFNMKWSINRIRKAFEELKRTMEEL